jgi:RimJ/RimL family protein N-acetyltransferase
MKTQPGLVRCDKVARDVFLVAMTDEMRTAFQRSSASFAQVVGLHLPAGWPQFPEAFGPRQSLDSCAPWSGYLFADEDRLVGNGGFVDSPDAKRTVEIGFEIAPEFCNLGYGSAAARKLIALAFEHGASRIVAHTLAQRNASNTALCKAGMGFAGVIPDPSLGQVWRYAINWPGLA